MAIVVKFSVAPFIFLYDLCSLIKKYYTCVNLYYSTRICTLDILFCQVATFTKIYQKQRPYVLLWMLWFYEKVYLMYLHSVFLVYIFFLIRLLLAATFALGDEKVICRMTKHWSCAFWRWRNRGLSKKMSDTIQFKLGMQKNPIEWPFEKT